MVQNTAPDPNPEPVSTDVVAFPIPDVYLYEPNLETTHLVNGTDYRQGRWAGSEQPTTMCGACEVPVGPDENLPDGVEHFADTLDPEEFSDDPVAIMDLTVLDLCGRCRASYGSDGVPSGVNVVRYEMDGSGWSR